MPSITNRQGNLARGGPTCMDRRRIRGLGGGISTDGGGFVGKGCDVGVILQKSQAPQCVGRGGWPGPRANWSAVARFFGTFRITGSTLDSAGAALASCTVHLFEAATDTEVQETISNGSGVYTFNIGQNAGYFYVVAYKPGSPDVAGTTVNTLAAAAV